MHAKKSQEQSAMFEASAPLDDNDDNDDHEYFVLDLNDDILIDSDYL